jgi:hypothetical protein
VTDPAYIEDRPLVPRPIEINVLASAEALHWARNVAVKAGADPHNFRAMMWCALTEAAQTERMLPANGPRGFSSGWPDCWQTPGEITGAYNDRNTERREAERDRRAFDQDLYHAPQRIRGPSAAAVSRYETVASWLRLCRALDKRRAIRLVWYRAHGRPYGWISQEDGRPPKLLRHERARQVVLIEGALKKRLGQG